MKPYCLPAVVLAASLSVTGSAPAQPAAGPGVVGWQSVTASRITVCPARLELSAEDRAALRVAEQHDADLADVKAGFFLEDHDVALVAGTVVVVVLIALLL